MVAWIGVRIAQGRDDVADDALGRAESPGGIGGVDFGEFGLNSRQFFGIA